MHFLPVFPAKELSLGSSSFVRCPRRIVGDRTVPTKVYKTTSGMEDVKSPPFHQTKNMVLASGGFQDNKRRCSFTKHAVTWWKSLPQDTVNKRVGRTSKGDWARQKTCPDLLSIKVSAVAEPATCCKKTGKGRWEVLGYAFPLPLVSATGRWWREYWSFGQTQYSYFYMKCIQWYSKG